LYKDELFHQCSNDYVRLILEIFPKIKQQIDSQIITGCGLIEHWIETCARQAENDMSKRNVDDRIAALTLMTEVWLSFTHYVDSKEEMANTILFMLKRALRERSHVLRLHATGLLFTALD